MTRMNLRTGLLVADTYFLDRQIGSGGSGVVWSAFDAQQVLCALKFLKDFEPKRRRRFDREIRLLSKLEHPNIVRIHAVVEFQGVPVLVMELLHGETLRAQFNREGPLPVPTACALLAPVARALAEAHHASIVHRDLKPENIFVAGSKSNATVKLLDFGMAKSVAAEGALESELTELGALVGTLMYMAPEQVLGLDALGPAVDAWAFGVILYEAIAGFRPIDGSTNQELVRRLLTDAILPLHSILPEVPEAVNELLRSLLVRKSDERLTDLARVGRTLELEGSLALIPSAEAFDEPELAVDDANATLALGLTGSTTSAWARALDLTPLLGRVVDVGLGATYRLERVLSESKLGVVFLGLPFADALAEPIVIKVIRPVVEGGAASADAKLIDKEVAALRDLCRGTRYVAHVVRFLGSGTLMLREGGHEVHWIAVEYVDGGSEGVTLRDRVLRSIERTGFAFGVTRASAAFEGILSGVRAIHDIGVIHRDLKPSNVLCTGARDSEVYKIADFGLSQVRSVETFGDMSVGTPGYCAPEQSFPDDVTAGTYSDVFSLAGLVFFTLTGEQYFQVNTLPMALVAAREATRRSLSTAKRLCPELRARPDVCSKLDDVLALASRANPRERPPTSGDFGRLMFGALEALESS